MLRRFLSAEARGGGARRFIVFKSPRASLAPLIEKAATFNLSQFVLDSPNGARARPSAAAFIDSEDGETLTFEQNFDNTMKFGAHLASKNVTLASVVILFSCNTIHYSTMWHGIVALGAIASTASSVSTPEELRRQIITAGATTVVTIPLMAAVAQSAMAGLPGVVLVVYTPEKCEGQLPMLGFRGSNADVCAIPFSSGTTGLPKGVQLTHANLSANLVQVQACEGMCPGDVSLVVLPYFHIYAMTVIMNIGLYAGATQVVFKKFDLARYTQSIESYKAAYLYIAPPIAIALAKHPTVLTVNRDSVRQIMSGAAPLGSAVQAEVKARFLNADVRQGYGMTETSPVTHLQRRGCAATGTIGSLVADTEAMLVGPDGVAGREGELWIRGPQVMKGYMKAEDTADVMRPGGWLATGDLARVENDGECFTITDRLKELIKVKGYQVAPAELEAVLLSHPDVQDTIVFAVPDGGACGEQPKAHVHLRHHVDRSDAKAEELMAFVAKVVSPYKRLAGVRFVDSVPKSAAGKLLRRVAQKMEADAK